ncbi:MAG: hypothetical protein ACXWYS_08150 [Gaiellaceae bacterium]
MRVPLLAGLAALLLLAGCGGGDDKLSDADFRSKANKLCLAYSQKVNSLPDPGGYEALAQYATDAHDALVVALDGLKELHPSDELEADYDTWLASGERALKRVEELEQAATAKNQRQIQRLSLAATGEDARADRVATRLGIGECAND